MAGEGDALSEGEAPTIGAGSSIEAGAPPGAEPAALAAEPAALAAEPAELARRGVRAWLDSVRKAIRDLYCTIDPRTLGLFRLVLGFLLTADCIRHWSEARVFYSNDGVLTNHLHLFRPSSGFNFSLFHAFSSPAEVHIAFALSCLCFFLFWIGYRTRLFSILSFVLVTSLDNRLVMVENGGYVVVNLLAFWAMFMPTGRRFSIDALRRSYREESERTTGELNQRDRPAWPGESFVSGAVLLATVNLAFVYYFNVVNKSGDVWRQGETVHYVLHLDRMVTGVAVFFREHVPYVLTRGLSWAVLSLEASLFAWILWPSGRRVTRLLAILGIWALHGSFGVMMRLGPFSWFMIGWSFLLVLPVHWDMLEAWYRRRARPLVVIYDASSGLAFALCRLFSRLDSLSLLRFEESESGAGPLFTAREEREGGRTFTGARALRAVVSAFPGGLYAYPFLVVLTLGALGPLFDWASARREGVSRFFGFPTPRGAAQPRRALALSPVSARLARLRARAREVLLVYLGICALWQMLSENKAIPKQVKEYLKPPWVPEPAYAVMQATIQYPRLYQGWGMFSPNPITDDGSLTVDAWTKDGRHIDPFTGKEPDLDLTDARGLGLPQIWQDYFNRIRLDRNKPYRAGLSDYLQHWHLSTGRPEDELVAFDVYWVRDQCPRPGETKAYKNETIALLTYRKPKYVPPEGMPALPPAPKVESAGD